MNFEKIKKIYNQKIVETLNNDEAIKSIFNKIEFLKLDNEERAQVAQKIKIDALWDKLYWIETILAAWIATLGLLQGSVAVIIGAMLIAPLLRPINWLSFSIATWEKWFFSKTLFVLTLSVIISIFIWYIFTNFIWIDFQNNSILSRTNPTIIDLFVAWLSAMVAVLSIKFSRLAESVAGVAMAASLMPPLAVVGIEFSLKNYSLSFWALMLFITNLIAIIIVATIFFWMFGFNPHKAEKWKIVLKRLAFVFLSLFIISIPLVQALNSIKIKKDLENNTKIYLNKILSSKLKKYKLNYLKIKKINKHKVVFDLSIKLPENINFYNTFKNEIIKKLSKYIWKDVELNIELVRIANIVSNVKKQVPFKEKIKQYIKNIFTKTKDFQLISYEIFENNQQYKIIISWVINNKKNEKEIFKKYENEIKKNLWKNISIVWIPLSKYKKPNLPKTNKYEKKKKEIEEKINNYLNIISTKNIYFDNIKTDFNLNNENITWLELKMNMYIPLNESGNIAEPQTIKYFEEKLKDMKKNLNIKTIRVNKFYYKKEEY